MAEAEAMVTLKRQVCASTQAAQRQKYSLAKWVSQVKWRLLKSSFLRRYLGNTLEVMVTVGEGVPVILVKVVGWEAVVGPMEGTAPITLEERGPDLTWALCP